MLEAICDVTNDYDSDDNYVFSDSQWTCAIGLKSLVSIERKEQLSIVGK